MTPEKRIIKKSKLSIPSNGTKGGKFCLHTTLLALRNQKKKRWSNSISSIDGSKIMRISSTISDFSKLFKEYFRTTVCLMTKRSWAIIWTEDWYPELNFVGKMRDLFKKKQSGYKLRYCNLELVTRDSSGIKTFAWNVNDPHSIPTSKVFKC